MKFAQHILFAGAGTWRIATHRAGEVGWHDVAANADAVADQLNRSGYDGQPILIAIASARCICSTLPVDDLPRNDFKARLYRLETQLPLALEQIVADFAPAVRVGDREMVLAVATQRSWIGELVASLESRQIAVGPIVPATLLAAQEASRPFVDSSFLLVADPAAPSDGAVDLIQFQASTAMRWMTIRPAAVEVHLQLEWQSLQSQPITRIGTIGVDEALLQQLNRITDIHIERISSTAQALAASSGANVLLERHKSPVNLRRGPIAVTDRWRMHRQAIDGVLAAAVLLLFALAITFGWRASQYSRSSARDQREMISMFQQTFPGYAATANVKAVVESEHRKLTNSPLAGDHAGSALSTLHAVLSCLPATADYSLQHLNFSGSGFELTGQLKSYEAADAIASAIRSSGMNVQPPEARRSADGKWSFTMRGDPRAPNGGAR